MRDVEIRMAAVEWLREHGHVTAEAVRAFEAGVMHGAQAALWEAARRNCAPCEEGVPMDGLLGQQHLGRSCHAITERGLLINLMWYTCPACGFDLLPHEPMSFSVCPCCVYRFNGADFEAHREKWVAAGMPWEKDERLKPDQWNPAAQLERLLASGWIQNMDLTSPPKLTTLSLESAR